MRGAHHGRGGAPRAAQPPHAGLPEPRGARRVAQALHRRLDPLARPAGALPPLLVLLLGGGWGADRAANAAPPPSASSAPPSLPSSLPSLQPPRATQKHPLKPFLPPSPLLTHPPTPKKQGVKSLLAVPISFVSEHIETLEEIDVEYRELAEESGIEAWGRRASPLFVVVFVAAVVVIPHSPPPLFACRGALRFP